MKKINVLSLFDGIACGRVALEKAGISINKYYASEINQYSIQIAKKNFPDIIELGDVRNINKKDIKENIDLLIGGSPCQSFSFIGYMDGMTTTEDGIKKELLTLEDYLEYKNKGYVFNRIFIFVLGIC